MKYFHYNIMKLRTFVILLTCIIFVLISIISTVFMIQVVPEYKKQFKDFDLELPAMTILVLCASDFVVRFWYLVVLFVSIALWGITKLPTLRF